MLVRPPDAVASRQRSEPAHLQMESLPSAPPLPADNAYALHTSYAYSPGESQHVQYPSLAASPSGDAEASRHAGSQSRQGQEVKEQKEPGHAHAGSAICTQGDESAEAASPLEHPAGAVAWAMKAAAGASSAAASVLSAWLPWQHGSSSTWEPPHQAPHQEAQQEAQSRPPKAPSTGRSAHTARSTQMSWRSEICWPIEMPWLTQMMQQG